MNFRRLQTQCNSIDDDDNVKLSSAHIKKLKNITKVETLTSNETASSSKSVVSKKKIDINIRKVIHITGYN